VPDLSVPAYWNTCNGTSDRTGGGTFFLVVLVGIALVAVMFVVLGPDMRGSRARADNAPVDRRATQRRPVQSLPIAVIAPVQRARAVAPARVEEHAFEDPTPSDASIGRALANAGHGAELTRLADTLTRGQGFDGLWGMSPSKAATSLSRAGLVDGWRRLKTGERTEFRGGAPDGARVAVQFVNEALYALVLTVPGPCPTCGAGLSETLGAAQLDWDAVDTFSLRSTAQLCTGWRVEGGGIVATCSTPTHTSLVATWETGLNQTFNE